MGVTSTFNSLEAHKIDSISIKEVLFVVAVGGDVLVARPGVLGLSDFIGVGSALLDDFILLLGELLSHLMQIEAVDFGVMGRLSALEGVDGGGLHAVLDVFEGSPPILADGYSSVL